MKLQVLRATAALAGALFTAAPALAQTAAPPAPEGSPIAISDPFVIPWKHDTMLACMAFTNVSDRPIQAVRFGLNSVQDDPLGSTPSDDYIDRLGTFAPGVAIRPPTRFLGTVNSNSAALQNCWETGASTIKTNLRITVLKVIYADGTVWLNPTPSEAMVSLTY